MKVKGLQKKIKNPGGGYEAKMYWGVGGNEAKMEEGTHLYQKVFQRQKIVGVGGGGLMRQNCRGRIPGKGLKEKNSGGGVQCR